MLLLSMFVRPKMGYIRGKIGLTGQFDRCHYLHPWVRNIVLSCVEAKSDLHGKQVIFQQEILNPSFLCFHSLEYFKNVFRVAAEWVLRCGGGVKFKHLDKWMWNYNAIPDGPKGKLMLEGINAKGVSITTGGLQHLGKCEEICPDSKPA